MGHTHPQQPPKLYPLAGGLLSIHLMRWRGEQGIMWGTRGLFLPVAAMAAMVVLVDVGRWRLTSDQPTVGIVKIVYGNIFFIPTQIPYILDMTSDPAAK